MLFAAFWLLARLIAPAAAMPAPLSEADAVALAALQTLCHGGEGPADPEQSPVHTDCLLCPACHLGAHVALPAPGGPALNPPTLTLIAIAAPLPPATGPPSRRRDAVQPTGPPTPSA